MGIYTEPIELPATWAEYTVLHAVEMKVISTPNMAGLKSKLYNKTLLA